MNQFKICEICGGTDGDDELVQTCTECRLTNEHPYCMRTFPDEDKPWICEECFGSKSEMIPDPIDLCPKIKEVSGGLTTPGPSRTHHPYGYYRHVKVSKVKQIPVEEVKRLASGAMTVHTSTATSARSRPTMMAQTVPVVKANPRISSGFAKNRVGVGNIGSSSRPSGTKRSEGNHHATLGVNPPIKQIPSGFAKNRLGVGNICSSSRPSGTKRSEDVDIKNGNAEAAMKSLQTSATLVKPNQQLCKAATYLCASISEMGVKALHSDGQEMEKSPASPLRPNQHLCKEMGVKALHSDGREMEKAPASPLRPVQTQNQQIKGSDSCATLTIFNLDAGDRNTHAQKLMLYHPYFPSTHVSWSGRCKILDCAERGKYHEGPTTQLSSRLRKAYGLSLELPVKLQAHTAVKISREVYELSLKMPVVQEVKLLPRSDIWTPLFHNDSPDLRDIALYIFPTADVESSEENYAKLLECVDAEDLVITIDVDGFELLIFSSKHLHTDMQDVICFWSRKQFLWGVFQPVKAAGIQIELPVPDHGGLDGHEDVVMEIDMKGGRGIAPLDIVVQRDHGDHSIVHDHEEVSMEIDMEGGKELCPPEIVVRKEDYSFRTVVQLEGCETTDNASSKPTTHTVSAKKNLNGDHSNIDDHSEIAMKIDVKGGKDLGLPEIVVEKYHSSGTAMQFDDGETADRMTPSKLGNKTLSKINVGKDDSSWTVVKQFDDGETADRTPPSEVGKRTLDAATPGFGELSSKECKVEKSGDHVNVQGGLVSVKVEGGGDLASNSILWTPPPARWVKLNVAVVSCSEGRRIAAGIIRDETARWLVGYNLKSESLGLEQAELETLLEGLKLAWERGYVKVVVELESSAVLELLNNDTCPDDPNRILISRCKERIRRREWECKLQVVGKEGNSSAQVLAQPFLCKPSGLNVLSDPPDDLNLFLQIDAMSSLM